MLKHQCKKCGRLTKKTGEHTCPISGPNNGKKMPEEIKRKISETKKRLIASGVIKPRTWSDEQRKINGELRKGVLNPMYGKTSWNKGKKSSLIARKKLSISRKGKMPKFIPTFKGLKHSSDYKEKMSKLYRGELSYNWKGGLTALRDAIRHCFLYRQWISDVFTKDNFNCQNCGARSVYLEAHHLKSFADIIKENNIDSLEKALECSELWNINNGQTLCKLCHKKITFN